MTNNMNKHKNKQEVKNPKKSSEIQEQEGRDGTTTIRTFRVVDCLLCRANTIHDVIFTFILLIVTVNVCKYAIHGCYALGVPNTHQPAPLTFQEFAWLTRVRELREQVSEPETLPVSCVGFEDRIPSWGTNISPSKALLSRWFSFSKGGIWIRSQEGMIFSTVTDRMLEQNPEVSALQNWWK